MNRKLVVIAVVLMAVAMLAVPLFGLAMAASPIIEVSGDISSGVSAPPTTTKTSGGNVFMSFSTVSTWSGDIEGTTTGSQTWIRHTGGRKPHTTFNVEIVFTTATVDGKTGTMIVQMNLDAVQGEGVGKWVIKAASGGLEGLHGGGRWLIKSGEYNRYEGTVHFSK